MKCFSYLFMLILIIFAFSGYAQANKTKCAPAKIEPQCQVTPPSANRLDTQEFCRKSSECVGKKIYDFTDFINVNWLKDVQVSPDGQRVLLQTDKRNLSSNKTESSLWILDLEKTVLRNITGKEIKATSGRWSPNSSKIAFTGTVKGDSQVYIMDSNGSNLKKVTSLANGASAPEWSSSGNALIFASDVFENTRSEAENKKIKNNREASLVKARIIDELPYQVFDHWRDGKVSHLFYMPLSSLVPVDIVPGNYDVPPIDLAGPASYSFAPDSSEVCLVTNTDKNLAWSTNNDLFLTYPGTNKIRRITENKANDSGVSYSPDGKYIAFTAMERPGYEADRRVLSLYDRETMELKKVTEKLDRSVSEYVWSPDSKKLYFTADDLGYHAIYSLDLSTENITKLTEKTYNTSLSLSPDGKRLFFLRQSIAKPADLYVMNIDGTSPQRLTDFNPNFASIAMNGAEEFSFEASDGVRVSGFMVKPPCFDKSKKYPLIYLIHGGPQGSWSDDFHQRWNTELFASKGYVVAALNFRGSVGFGQTFTDGVSKEWGGRPYEDLMEGIDYLTGKYEFIDKDKMAAVGASYGGYMVNWIMGHTDRFKCSVCLSGVFNTVSEYGTTEELWFPEWEFGGTPYVNRDLYEKWNPVNYVCNFKTPCLVIHGEEDYRVPVSEGKQLFTALKRNGVPARFLYFPDECHFIRKPQNMKLWYDTMDSWFNQWLK